LKSILMSLSCAEIRPNVLLSFDDGSTDGP
jgi:hypothetical protein